MASIYSENRDVVEGILNFIGSKLDGFSIPDIDGFIHTLENYEREKNKVNAEFIKGEIYKKLKKMFCIECTRIEYNKDLRRHIRKEGFVFIEDIFHIYGNLIGKEDKGEILLFSGYMRLTKTYTWTNACGIDLVEESSCDYEVKIYDDIVYSFLERNKIENLYEISSLKPCKSLSDLHEYVRKNIENPFYDIICEHQNEIKKYSE